MAPKKCVGIFNGLTPTKILETQFQVFNITLPSEQKLSTDFYRQHGILHFAKYYLH
jgi:hypothetical protein